MGDTNVNLAELIGSRICHDLISPIGAITNGLELLEMVGSVQGPEMELISGSVGQCRGKDPVLSRRLWASASDQPLGRAEVALSCFRILTSKAHRTCTRQLARDRCHAAQSGQAGFLALMCCESAMPFGAR